MQNMTLEQLRAASDSGGISGVILKGQGSTEWLAAEIQESIDDPRPSITHDEVMSRMGARIARHKAAD
jgi:hypothetical protein